MTFIWQERNKLEIIRLTQQATICTTVISRTFRYFHKSIFYVVHRCSFDSIWVMIRQYSPRPFISLSSNPSWSSIDAPQYCSHLAIGFHFKSLNTFNLLLNISKLDKLIISISFSGKIYEIPNILYAVESVENSKVEVI